MKRQKMISKKILILAACAATIFPLQSTHAANQEDDLKKVEAETNSYIDKRIEEGKPPCGGLSLTDPLNYTCDVTAHARRDAEIKKQCTDKGLKSGKAAVACQTPIFHKYRAKD
ncbi:hypothetical protein KIK84_16275 [Curvibacter sp. CHRR-16]|uniref:hypothetical protein n=1 Tax=Curvibacter sp. CHRR-16 TaxID=2835872 RepID=UPI001BDA791A|nr:hypothetical protein [Curvibacter sp. CHRR-16]MBT0571872.1 hypothetical protein [Curvibacter sp. CHRR-16]